jgi:hypothetical protein
MNISGFLRSRQWIFARRLALIALIVFLGIRNYAGPVWSWLRAADPQRDVAVIKSEFRTDLGEEKPAWVIGLRNNSNTTTYDQIELEATYMNNEGKVLETDRLVVKQKLTPGHEQTIASTDLKPRVGATNGTLKVIGARRVKP